MLTYVICAVLVCWNIVTIYVLYSAAIAKCLTVQSREQGDQPGL